MIIPCGNFDIGKLYVWACLVIHKVALLSAYMNYLFVVNVIRQRVRLIRQAVEKFDKLSNRIVACSDRALVSVVACPEKDNYRYSNSTEIHYQYNI